MIRVFSVSLLMASAASLSVAWAGSSGRTDLGDLAPPVGAILSGVASGDRFGTSVTIRGDFNGDGVSDLAISAPGVDISVGGNTLINAGEVYVLYGGTQATQDGFDVNLLRSSRGGDGSLGFVIQGEFPGVQIGFSIDAPGDMNGDGLDDLIIGTPFLFNFAGEGGAYLVFGSQSMPAELNLADLRTGDGSNSGLGVALLGSQNGAGAGIQLAGVGDVSGDGIADVIIGNNQPASGNSRESRSFLLYGRPASQPWPDVFNLVNIQVNLANGTEGFVVISPARSNRFGATVAGLGDFTGDGLNDFIMGAANEGDNLSDRGAAYIIPGRVSGPGEGFDVGLDLRLGENRATVSRLFGPNDGEMAGTSVAGIGDINGDGREDAAISARFATLGGEDSGLVYVVYGRAANNPLGTDFDLDRVRPDGGAESNVGFVISGAPGDQLGTFMARLGDINGDGVNDFVLGARGASDAGTDSGRAYVLYGRPANRPFPSHLRLTEVADGDETLGFVFTGEASGDGVGAALAGQGDIDGDGSSDLIVGVPLNDVSGASTGRTYTYFGMGADQTLAFAGELSRAWYDPSRSGEGVLTEFGTRNGQPEMFATWYTYLDGEQFWLVTDPISFSAGASSITANLFRTSGGEFGSAFDTALVSTDAWGTVMIDLLACDQLDWRYRSADGQQSGTLEFIPLLPDQLDLPGCPSTAAKTLQFGDGIGRELAGTWWNPSRAGEGIVIDLENRGATPTVFFSWFTFLNGQQLWVVGSAPYDVTGNDLEDIPLVVTRGADFGSLFDPADVEGETFGTATLRFDGCNSATLEFTREFPMGESESGSIALQRFTEGLLDFDCID
jgi:hypothetical protein